MQLEFQLQLNGHGSRTSDRNPGHHPSTSCEYIPVTQGRNNLLTYPRSPADTQAALRDNLFHTEPHKLICKQMNLIKNPKIK